MRETSVPKALDSIADVILAYKAKAKSKPGKKRKRLAAKFASLTKDATHASKQE